MFWYNVISHNSSYYFKMYISEITKFPCQLQKKRKNSHTVKFTNQNSQHPDKWWIYSSSPYTYQNIHHPQNVPSCPFPVNLLPHGAIPVLFFLFGIWISSCSNIICWKDSPFCIAFAPFPKINWPYMCGSISGVSILLHWHIWLSPPPPVLLRYNWHTALYKFKVYSLMIWLTYIMEWLPQWV